MCQHVAFLNHSQLSRHAPCNELLLKKVHTKYSVSLQPFKVYPYRSIKSSLAALTSSPDFLKNCELWQNRSSHVNTSLLGDVYDGDVWNVFNEFLNSPFCYMLTLNGIYILLVHYI